MTEQPELFNVARVKPPTEGLSAGQKLTLRNNQSIANGVHPVSRRPITGNGETCGSCSHHFSHSRNKTYHKCDLNVTGGPGTDIRVSWPACDAWAACDD